MIETKGYWLGASKSPCFHLMALVLAIFAVELKSSHIVIDSKSCFLVIFQPKSLDLDNNNKTRRAFCKCAKLHNLGEVVVVFTGQ